MLGRRADACAWHRRPHFRTTSKSHPVGFDGESSHILPSSSMASSSRGVYVAEAREHSAFRSWQFPASPDSNDNAMNGRMESGLDSIIEDDDTSMSSSGSDGSEALKGKGRPIFQSRTSGGVVNSQHHTTPSLPYASFHHHQSTPSNDSPTAYRSSRKRMASGTPASSVLSRTNSFGPSMATCGPFVIIPYLFSNLRRAKYNDLCFSCLFLASLLAFFSALIGLGYDVSTSNAAGAPFASPLPIGGLGGMRRVAAEEANSEAEIRRKQTADLLRMVKPIPVRGEKDETPLFADVLPKRSRPKKVDREEEEVVVVDPVVAAPLEVETSPAEEVVGEPVVTTEEIVEDGHAMTPAEHAMEHPDHVDETTSDGAGLFGTVEEDDDDLHDLTHRHADGEANHMDVDVDDDDISPLEMQRRPVRALSASVQVSS